MTKEQLKKIENSVNELIAEAVEGGGFVYLKDDNKTNDWIIRLTRPIRLSFYGGYKGDAENGSKQ